MNCVGHIMMYAFTSIIHTFMNTCLLGTVVLTLTVPLTTIDALQHFETG